MTDSLQIIMRDQLGEAKPERRRIPRRRLIIDIPPELHRRILTICSTRGIPVNEAARDALEHAFPV